MVTTTEQQQQDRDEHRSSTVPFDPRVKDIMNPTSSPPDQHGSSNNKVRLELYANKLLNVAGLGKGTSDPFAVVTLLASNPRDKPRIIGKTEVYVLRNCTCLARLYKGMPQVFDVTSPKNTIPVRFGEWPIMHSCTNPFSFVSLLSLLIIAV